mgnify:CR=1 FL=1
MDNIKPVKISIHELQLINKLKNEYEKYKKDLIQEIFDEILRENKPTNLTKIT